MIGDSNMPNFTNHLSTRDMIIYGE
jgi:hypothetical protein